MLVAPLPDTEARRLRTLRGLQVLDTPHDPVLDGLVRSAAALTGCPISLVSLVDTDRQWFKASTGLDASETPREFAFCAHAILGDELFEVSDATQDPRFADNPLVTGAPNVRFYAGVPLTVDGDNIGTLCVIDHAPRQLDAPQRELLHSLALAVEHWMRSQRQRDKLRTALAERDSLFQHMAEGVLLLDRQYRLLDANPAMLTMLGAQRDDLLTLRLHDLLAEHEHARLDSTPFEHLGRDKSPISWEAVRRDGSRFQAEVSMRAVDGQRMVAVVRDVTARRQQELQLRQLSLAVEQSPGGVLITYPNGVIRYANAQARRYSGRTREELIGRHLRGLRAGPMPAKQLEGLKRALRQGEVWRGQLAARHKEGEVYPLAVTVTPIRNLQGQVSQYLVMVEAVARQSAPNNGPAPHRAPVDHQVMGRCEAT